MEFEIFNTGPYIRIWRMQLFIYRRCYCADWRDLNSWGLDADGAFAIRTPWFMWYPW